MSSYQGSTLRKDNEQNLFFFVYLIVGVLSYSEISTVNNL